MLSGRKKWMTGLATAALLLVFALPVSAESIVYKLDLSGVEAGAKPAGLEFQEEGGKIETADLGEAGKALYLHDPGPTRIGISHSFAPLTGKVTVELDFMQPTRSNTAEVFTLIAENGQHAVRIETQNHFFAYKNADNSWTSTNAENTNNTFTNVKVVADVPAKKADVYINGTLVHEGLAFYSEVDNIAQVTSSTPGTSERSHYIRGLVISGEGAAAEAAPAPAPAEPAAPAPAPEAPAQPAAPAVEPPAGGEAQLPQAMPQTGAGGASGSWTGGPMLWAAAVALLLALAIPGRRLLTGRK